MTDIPEVLFDGGSIKIKIKDFADRLDLKELVTCEREFIEISSYNISRPGIHLTGHYEHFSEGRIQVFGKTELQYLATLDNEQRKGACDMLFSHQIPCVIICCEKLPFNEIESSALEKNIILLKSLYSPTKMINELSLYLNEALAPAVLVHGDLIDIYGVGVLLLGKSGVGKSEAALELIQRGHRLAADDAVVIKKVGNRIIGEAPPIVRHMMEIRGVGVVNIKELYGSGAIKLEQEIDMIVKLEEWDESKTYETGVKAEDYYVLHDINIPLFLIPVKPGRNVASILEVAAKNFRLKFMGYDAFEELNKRLKNKENY